jgi:hypothetical protein
MPATHRGFCTAPQNHHVRWHPGMILNIMDVQDIFSTRSGLICGINEDPMSMEDAAIFHINKGFFYVTHAQCAERCATIVFAVVFGRFDRSATTAGSTQDQPNRESTTGTRANGCVVIVTVLVATLSCDQNDWQQTTQSGGIRSSDKTVGRAHNRSTNGADQRNNAGTVDRSVKQTQWTKITTVDSCHNSQAGQNNASNFICSWPKTAWPLWCTSNQRSAERATATVVISINRGRLFNDHGNQTTVECVPVCQTANQATSCVVAIIVANRILYWFAVGCVVELPVELAAQRRIWHVVEMSTWIHQIQINNALVFCATSNAPGAGTVETDHWQKSVDFAMAIFQGLFSRYQAHDLAAEHVGTRAESIQRHPQHQSVCSHRAGKDQRVDCAIVFGAFYTISDIETLCATPRIGSGRATTASVGSELIQTGGTGLAMIGLVDLTHRSISTIMAIFILLSSQTRVCGAEQICTTT